MSIELERLKGEIVFLKPYLVNTINEYKDYDSKCRINTVDKYTVFVSNIPYMCDIVMSVNKYPNIGIIVHPLENTIIANIIGDERSEIDNIVDLFDKDLCNKILHYTREGVGSGDVHLKKGKNMTIWDFNSYKIIYKE